MTMDFDCLSKFQVSFKFIRLECLLVTSCGMLAFIVASNIVILAGQKDTAAGISDGQDSMAFIGVHSIMRNYEKVVKLQ